MQHQDRQELEERMLVQESFEGEMQLIMLSFGRGPEITSFNVKCVGVYEPKCSSEKD